MLQRVMLHRVKRFGIILAGGSGQRFGDQIPKQFIRLAGESVLRRSVQALASGSAFDHIVVDRGCDEIGRLSRTLSGMAHAVRDHTRILEDLVAQGHLGQKSGRGFFDWTASV